MEVEDYLLFMFSMKGIGKRVDFNHVKEKVNRDLGRVSDVKIKNSLENLISKNYMEKVGNLFGITSKGKEFFRKIFPKIEGEIEKVNKPWLIVYRAKEYYPKVARTILEFCKDRYVGFYALFTEKRFFRRDFKGKKIVLRNLKDLMFFVNMHCIDIIPCVHRIGIERPDWLIIDIDPGPEVDFEKVKIATKVCFKICKELKLNPSIKFSGSKGFQIWSLIEDFTLPEDYNPLVLKTERRKRNYFSFFADMVRVIQREVDEELPNLTTSETLEKEKRRNMILFDPSSMKPMGLVRVPYGVHSKSGLVSLPLNLKEIDEFKFEDARPEMVEKRYEKKGNEFILKPSSIEKVYELFKS